MSALEFKSVRNGGRLGELETLYLVYPWLKEIIGTRGVSVVNLMTLDALPGYKFTEMAMGYNATGRVILLKDDVVTKDVTWNEVHVHRRDLGLKGEFLNSPQTEITDNDDTCVVVQDHAEDKDSGFSGISIQVFLCAEKRTFGESLEVRAWFTKPILIKQLRETGFRTK